ncbi:MAG: guanylate kinase [Desulfobacteraceae bacterium IS3]|nr:MAG: guanylate kinase [Desulfobacteraceae bacterium IS3]
MTDKSGHLFIVSAPSGAGKTTLCKALLANFPDLRFSVSHTTRLPRAGERDGIDYVFITKDAFVKGIETGKWAEWAELHGNFYGTSAEFLDAAMSAGHDVLLDIDVQGMRQIIGRYPQAVTIFIMPPSFEVLKARLESRATDKKDVIAARLLHAQKEMAEKELYRHVIVNDRLQEAERELTALVESYRL